MGIGLLSAGAYSLCNVYLSAQLIHIFAKWHNYW